jgi:hypothetical protein
MSDPGGDGLAYSSLLSMRPWQAWIALGLATGFSACLLEEYQAGPGHGGLFEERRQRVRRFFSVSFSPKKISVSELLLSVPPWPL